MQDIPAEGNTNCATNHKKDFKLITGLCPVQKGKVMDSGGTLVEILAMIDSGSNTSLLSKNAAERRGIAGTVTHLTMNLAGGEKRSEASEIIEITIASTIEEDIRKTLEVYTIKKPCSAAKTISKGTIEHFPHILEVFHRSFSFQGILGMPWNENGPPKRSNYDIALKRMQSAEKSFQRKGCFEIVNEEVQKLLHQDFIIKVPTEEVDHSQPECYLPLQVVFTPEKTTKVRLVFDACSKGHDGLSLNNHLEKGPNYINSLPNVLMGWRWNEVAYSGDIRKMFNQVLLNPDDQVFHSLTASSDGGEQAYGAVIFLRWKLTGGDYQCVPVMIKAFVAPLKKKSIPRLELLGFLALVMYVTCVKALDLTKAQDWERFFWVDSTTVLSWVRTPPREFRPFWSEGPSFLKLPEEKWPTFQDHTQVNAHVDDLEAIKEKKAFRKEKKARKHYNAFAEVCPELNQPESEGNPILSHLLKSCSTYSKIRRTLAYVRRFIRNARKMSPKSGPISVPELKAAEARLLKWSQFLKWRLDKKLVAKKGEDGLLRAHGRLEVIRSLPEELRKPIILPQDHPFVILLLRALHERRGHCGYKSLMHEARKRFWIIGLRRMAKTVTSKCVTCRKLRNRPLNQLLRQIPNLRVAAGFPAFSTTAMDMFGPIQIKLGRKTLKEDQVIFFTCTTSRAIHLELVTDKTSDAFLMAFRRFACLRGYPSVCWSDHGTHLVGAQGYLRETTQNWDFPKIKSVLSDKFGCEFRWEWNPPHASHQNGVVETLIKSVRQALNATCKNQAYSEEQWRTFLSEVTFLVNGRPLYPISDDIWEVPPITPNDLLLGHHNPPPQPEPEERTNPRQLLRSTQNRVADFWRSWMKNFNSEEGKKGKCHMFMYLCEQADILNMKHNCDVVIMMPNRHGDGHTLTMYGTAGAGVAFIRNRNDIKISEDTESESTEGGTLESVQDRTVGAALTSSSQNNVMVVCRRDTVVLAAGHLEENRREIHDKRVPKDRVCVLLTTAKPDVIAPFIAGDPDENSFLEKGNCMPMNTGVSRRHPMSPDEQNIDSSLFGLHHMSREVISQDLLRDDKSNKTAYLWERVLREPPCQEQSSVLDQRVQVPPLELTGAMLREGGWEIPLPCITEWDTKAALARRKPQSPPGLPPPESFSGRQGEEQMAEMRNPSSLPMYGGERPCPGLPDLEAN
ncbi:hypothetical protein AWC38_SpisGene3710 [Stylophora pistillata]|uniref:Integrase zinc-binding domain-containing protein n=1 Tax=Stylophora pistillata TaxID=50429 RepID=A0A2B4SQT7_STYPI|nr:hypothetical protein AWC38_SpisGene3710 [Stylophora pistillata]